MAEQNPVTKFWKINLTSNPKPTASFISLFDLLFETIGNNINFRYNVNNETGDIKVNGIKLDHDIIAYHVDTYNTKGEPKTSFLSDFDVWAQYGIDIGRVFYDKRGQRTKQVWSNSSFFAPDSPYEIYMVFPATPGDVLGTYQKEFFYYLFDKDSALFPKNVEGVYQSAVWMKDDTNRVLDGQALNAWGFYNPPTVGYYSAGQPNTDNIQSLIILCENDSDFETSAGLSAGQKAFKSIALNPYVSVDRPSLVDMMIRLLNLREFAIIYNGETGVEGTGSETHFRENMLMDNGKKFIEFLRLSYTQLLLKNTYVWVRSSFYADYVIADSFNQDLHQKAQVIHKNIIVGEDSDFVRYDNIDFGEGNLSDDGDYAGGSNPVEGRSEASRPYLPKTVPSIDRLSEKLVPGFTRVEPPYDGSLEINDEKCQKIEQVMDAIFEATKAPNSRIGALQAESTSRAFEKNENIPKEILYPFGYFDNKTELTPEEFAQYKRTVIDYLSVAGGGYAPAIVPAAGNDAIAGRIFSTTIDELWEYIKRLVDGRSVDPLRPDYSIREPEGMYNTFPDQINTYTRDEEPTLFSKNAQLNDQDTRLPIVQNFSFLYDKKLNPYITLEVDNPNYLRLQDDQAIRYIDFEGVEHYINETITEQEIAQLDPYFNYSLPLLGDVYQETQYVHTIVSGLDKYEYLNDGYYKPEGWVSYDDYISGILTDPFPSGTKWYNDYVLSKPIRQVKINELYQRLPPERKANNKNYGEGKYPNGDLVEWSSEYSATWFPDGLSGACYTELGADYDLYTDPVGGDPDWEGLHYVNSGFRGASAIPPEYVDGNFIINYNSFITSADNQSLNFIYQKPFYSDPDYLPPDWEYPPGSSAENPFDYDEINGNYRAIVPLNIGNPHFQFVERNFENAFSVKDCSFVAEKKIKNKLWEMKRKDIFREDFDNDEDFGNELNVQWEKMGGTYYGELVGKVIGETVANVPYGKEYVLLEDHLFGKVYRYKQKIVLEGEPSEYTVEIVDTARRLYDKKFLFEYYFDGVWLKKERIYDLYPAKYEKYEGVWYPLNRNWAEGKGYPLFIDNVEDIEQEPKYLIFPKREEWPGSITAFNVLYQKYFERQIFKPIEQAYYPYYSENPEYDDDTQIPPLVNNCWRFNTQITGIVKVVPSPKYMPIYVLSDKYTKNLKYIPHKIYSFILDATPQKVAIGDPLDYKYKQVERDNTTDVTLIATKYVSMPTYFSYSIFDGLKELSKQLTQYAQSEQYDIYSDNGLVVSNYREIVNYLPWKQERDAHGNPIKLQNITNESSQILAQGEPNGVDSVWGPRKNPMSLRELEAYINQTKYNLITLSRYVQTNFTIAGFATQGVHKAPETSASASYAGATTDNLDEIEIRQLAQIGGGGLYQLHRDYNLNPNRPNTVYVKDGFDPNATKNTLDMDIPTYHYGAPALFNDLNSPFDYTQKVSFDEDNQENIRSFNEITREEYGSDPLLPGSSLDYEADDVYLSAAGVWKYKFDKLRVPVLETTY